MMRTLLTMVLLLAPAAVSAQAARLDGSLVGAFGLGRRNAAVAGSVGTASGSGPSLDGTISYGRFGLLAHFRSAEYVADSGAAAVGSLASMEVFGTVRLSMFTAEAGMGQRTFTGSFAARKWTYAAIAGRLEIPVGASGVTAGARLSVTLSAKETPEGSAGTGSAAETYVRVRPWSAPFFLHAGYRVERFTVDDSVPLPDETSTIVVGGGLRLRR